MAEGKTPVLVLRPVHDPLGPTKRETRPPFVSLYAAAGIREAGHPVTFLNLFRSGAAWTTELAAAGRYDAVVLIHREYNRALPLSSLKLVAEEVRARMNPSFLSVAGVGDADEGREILGLIPEVDRCFHYFPEVFVARWLAGDDVSAVSTARGPADLGSGPFPRIDADRIPFPAWDLLDTHAFFHGAEHRHKYVPCGFVLAIRGCPYQCAFCDKKTIATEKLVHFRSPENVIAEVEHLIRTFGVRDIQFCESNFTMKKSWALEVCERLERLPRRVAWSAHLRADKVDRELLEAMARAGCWNVLFGVETADWEIRKRIRKDIPDEAFESLIRDCRELGIETTASFMFGLPGETPALARETIRLARRLEPDYAQFMVHKAQELQPVYPGDRITDDWDTTAWDIPGQIYLPAAFRSADELKALRRRAFREFYLRPSYVLGRLRRVRSLEEVLRLTGGLRSLGQIIRS